MKQGFQEEIIPDTIEKNQYFDTEASPSLETTLKDDLLCLTVSIVFITDMFSLPAILQ